MWKEMVTDLGRGSETIHPMQEVSTTGGLGSMDVERNGSMDLERGNETIHPMQEVSTTAGLGSTTARPNRRMSLWIFLPFVVLNIVIFIVEMFINDCPKNLGDDNCTLKFLGRLSFQPLVENFLIGPSSATLLKMGALEWSKVVREHQGWRLITCIWLHAGAFHLYFNMFSLVIIGIHLEQEFGFVRIGIVYLVSAFGGSVLSALFNQNGASVGSSGALFGLLGVMLSELIINWTIDDNCKGVAVHKLLLIIFISIALGLLENADNFAHIGGFISGILLGFVFLMWPQFGWVNRKNIPPGSAVNCWGKWNHNEYHSKLLLLLPFLFTVGYFVCAVLLSHNVAVLSQRRANATGMELISHGVNANMHCRVSGIHYEPTSRWSCNDGVIACQEFQSDSDFILVCENGGKTKFYPFQNTTEAKKRQLCNQQCS